MIVYCDKDVQIDFLWKLIIVKNHGQNITKLIYVANKYYQN